MRIIELIASLLSALMIAAGIAMPLIVPGPATALIVWALAFVLVVAFSTKLERAAPGAVDKLWSIELRIVAMALQVALDLLVPHLGDALVLVGYVLLISLTLRLSTFPYARVTSARAPWAPWNYLAFVPMLIVTLPAIWVLALVIELLDPRIK